MMRVTFYGADKRVIIQEERADSDREVLLQHVIDGDVIDVNGRRVKLRFAKAGVSREALDLYVEDLGPVPQPEWVDC